MPSQVSANGTSCFERNARHVLQRAAHLDCAKHEEKLPLVTADPVSERYPIDVIW
jgi:hypothetical protein